MGFGGDTIVRAIGHDFWLRRREVLDCLLKGSIHTHIYMHVTLVLIELEAVDRKVQGTCRYVYIK